MTQLRFEIGNRGTKAVNAGWTFMVKIPYAAGYTFYSQPQQAMGPGDKVVYTMNFQSTEYIPGTYQTGPVSVITDPSNLVRELSENNNTSVANVTLQ